MKAILPHLDNFTVSVKCFIRTEIYQKSLGPAQWQMIHPAGALSRQPLRGETLPDDEKLVNVTSLPIDVAHAVTFTGYDGHSGSACCSAIRVQEDDRVGESA
jgi:hypothetical protein